MDHNVPGILLFYHPCDTVDGQAITNNYEDSYETLCIENVFSFFYGIKSQKRYPVIHIAVDRRCAKNDYGIGTLGVASWCCLWLAWNFPGKMVDFHGFPPVNGWMDYESLHLFIWKCAFHGKIHIYAGIFQRDYLVRVWKKRCNQNWWVDGGRNAIFLWKWILDILASCVMSPLKLKAPDSAKDHITWYNKLEIILAPTQSVFLRRSKYQTRIVPKIYLEPIFIATFNGKLTISGPFVFRVHLQKTRRHDNDDFLVATPPRYRAEFSPALRGGAKLLLLALRLSWTAEAEAGLVKNWILQIFEEQDHGMDK